MCTCRRRCVGKFMTYVAHTWCLDRNERYPVNVWKHHRCYHCAQYDDDYDATDDSVGYVPFDVDAVEVTIIIDFERTNAFFVFVYKTMITNDVNKHVF